MPWGIHSVNIKNTMDFNEARIHAQHIIKNKNRKFYKLDPSEYVFRNLPKTKFNDYRSKQINPDIRIVFGRLKPEYKNLK